MAIGVSAEALGTGAVTEVGGAHVRGAACDCAYDALMNFDLEFTRPRNEFCCYVVAANLIHLQEAQSSD